MSGILCTPDEHRLIAGGATQLVVPGDPICHSPDVNVDWWECAYCGKLYDVWPAPAPVCMYVAPQRWVDATGPCDHQGHVRNQYDPTDQRQWGGYGTGAHRGIEPCDGRKRVALAVTQIPDGPTCQSVSCDDEPFPAVLFAHATVEVLPVVDANDSDADHGLHHACLFDGITFIHHGKLYDELMLDPLPVPGRDFVVLLGKVEMTP